MKKYLLLMLSIFLFTPKVFATNLINKMDIYVEISEDGNAFVTEEWQINNQNNTYYEKEFYEINGAVITDVVISDSNNSEYTYVDKFSTSKNLIYHVQGTKKNKLIKFMTNGREATIKIQYKVDGMITKFDDIEGINWYFLSTSKNEEIRVLNIYISGPIEFNETNTALYGIGSNVTNSYEEGKIHITSSDVLPNSKIKLIASIADYEFEHHLVIKENLKDYYDKVSSRSPLYGYIEVLFDNIVLIIIIFLVIVSLIIILIIKLTKRNKLNNDYKNIISFNKENVVSELKDTDYFDSVPCNNNLYKMYFLANYYNIIKNRSSLIGAILFKWILEGIIEIKKVDEKYQLIIRDDLKFKNELDQSLYNMLLNASINNTLDNNKLIRHALLNDESLIGWYDNVIKYVIKNEYKNGNVTVKGNKIILNKTLFNEAVKIQGLKKYLLNFNQVPRSTELTEELYKNLLVASILLRVDENLSQEILRKSPDNINASLLEEFSKVKKIYTNIYSTVYEEFKKKKHKRNIKMYNPKYGIRK